MLKKLAIAAAFLLIAAGVLLVPRALDALRDGIRPEARRKRFSSTLAEGVSVDHPDASGADLIRCGSCRIEKLRKGPLTFGGINVLVLEDLQVTLSDSLVQAREESPEADREPSVREVLGALGSMDRFLEMQGLRGSFSALRIERLGVFRLDGTNPVPVFSASRGEACRDGLRLSGCVVSEDGCDTPRHDAVLRVRPRLRLEWRGGGMDLLPQGSR